MPSPAKVKMKDESLGGLYFRKLWPYVAKVGEVSLILSKDLGIGDLYYAPSDTIEICNRGIRKQLIRKSVDLKDYLLLIANLPEI